MTLTRDNSLASRFGGISIVEKTISGPTDYELLREIFRHLFAPEKAAPTRAQIASACRSAFRRAFVHVGGHHVAVHLDGHNDRSFMLVGSTADWN